MSIADDFRGLHTVAIEEPPKKNGWTAVVHRTTDVGTQVTAYDSVREHGTAGVFATTSAARDHGYAWISAKIEQAVRVDELRAQRKDALPDRLDKNGTDQATAKAQASEANATRKALESEARRLIEEARNPLVTLEFSPGRKEFSVWDEPSVSGGTMDLHGNTLRDPRQGELPGIGESPEELDKRADELIDASEEVRGAYQSRVDAAQGLDPGAVEWPDDADTRPYSGEEGGGDGVA